jgi:tryptophan synthase
MEDLCASSDSFVYVMSRMAVVGPWQQIGDGIIQLIGRVDCVTEGTVPAVIAFGISTRAQFWRIAKHAEGVAIGNPIIEALENAEPGTGAQKVKRLCLYIAARLEWHVEIPERPQLPNEASDAPVALDVLADQPAASAASTTRPAAFDDLSAPTYLKSCLSELETAFAAASADPDFWDEIRSHAINANRPTSLEVAERLTAHAGGARIWLKREDLSHTGSHKINNALGQIILARRLGKAAIIAETATGAHGIATATLCAIFNMRCSIFMGSRDFETQPGKVSRMRLLGATVIPVQGVSGRCDGSGTVRDALNVAFRIWVVEQETTHLVLGSVFGPDPFPTIVRSFQMVIGTETRAQFQAVNGDGKLPDALVACVGGGSNATGMFYPFVQDLGVALVGVKAGRSGPMAGNSAVLTRGLDGVLRGVNTHVLPGEVRYASRTYSVSAGLDYPGVGTELMSWKESGRATFTAANDTEALGAFCLLSRMEGIMPALETAHAIAGALRVAKDIGAGGDVVVCLSGRGDDDVQTVADILPTLGENV